MSSSPLPDELTRGPLHFTVLHRPQRRTLEITVERDGSLSVKAPEGATIAQIESMIDARSDWIHRKLAEKHTLWGAPVTKQLVEGEGFAYLGRNHRLTLNNAPASGDTAGVRLERGRLVLSCGLAEGPDEAVEALRGWYRRVGTPWVQRRIRPWAARLGAGDIEVHVVDLGYRWGSTRGRNRINVHWATLQHRPPLVDYVLVHELAHLHEPHHSPQFWRVVTQAMPDHDDRRRELADIGARTWLGEVE